MMMSDARVMFLVFSMLVTVWLTTDQQTPIGICCVAQHFGWMTLVAATRTLLIDGVIRKILVPE
jgi:hypothetical protein